LRLPRKREVHGAMGTLPARPGSPWCNGDITGSSGKSMVQWGHYRLVRKSMVQWGHYRLVREVYGAMETLPARPEVHGAMETIESSVLRVKTAAALHPCPPDSRLLTAAPISMHLSHLRLCVSASLREPREHGARSRGTWFQPLGTCPTTLRNKVSARENMVHDAPEHGRSSPEHGFHAREHGVLPSEHTFFLSEHGHSSPRTRFQPARTRFQTSGTWFQPLGTW
jgi:hypothetical protein